MKTMNRNSKHDTMDLPPVEIRQVRPCTVCAFFVHISDTREAICTLNKAEKKGHAAPRWRIEDPAYPTTWICWFNITPEEIEGTDNPWVKSIVNESLRFYNSAHSRREITRSRRSKGRRK
jgi:hypothetical protein